MRRFAELPRFPRIRDRLNIPSPSISNLKAYPTPDAACRCRCRCRCCRRCNRAAVLCCLQQSITRPSTFRRRFHESQRSTHHLRKCLRRRCSSATSAYPLRHQPRWALCEAAEDQCCLSDLSPEEDALLRRTTHLRNMRPEQTSMRRLRQ